MDEWWTEAHINFTSITVCSNCHRKNQRLVLSGSVLGESMIDSCFEVLDDDTPELNDLDVLSGAPVFGLI